jgi:DNA invertase Pin-like site-specific DNA recombinase
MMEEVEAGHVEAVIVKDRSRLRRDYLKVGQIMELLLQHHKPGNHERQNQEDAPQRDQSNVIFDFQ